MFSNDHVPSSKWAYLWIKDMLSPNSELSRKQSLENP